MVSLDESNSAGTLRAVTSARLLMLAALLRRFLAAGSALLVLGLTIAAVSPELHHGLHTDDGSASSEGCAVDLFANGVSLPLGAVAALPPTPAWQPAGAAVAADYFPLAPKYLRQPERGPPARG